MKAKKTPWKPLALDFVPPAHGVIGMAAGQELFDYLDNAAVGYDVVRIPAAAMAGCDVLFCRGLFRRILTRWAGVRGLCIVVEDGLEDSAIWERTAATIEASLPSGAPVGYLDQGRPMVFDVADRMLSGKIDHLLYFVFADGGPVTSPMALEFLIMDRGFRRSHLSEASFYLRRLWEFGHLLRSPAGSNCYYYYPIA